MVTHLRLRVSLKALQVSASGASASRWPGVSPLQGRLVAAALLCALLVVAGTTGADAGDWAQAPGRAQAAMQQKNSVRSPASIRKSQLPHIKP